MKESTQASISEVLKTMNVRKNESTQLHRRLNSEGLLNFRGTELVIDESFVSWGRERKRIDTINGYSFGIESIDSGLIGFTGDIIPSFLDLGAGRYNYYFILHGKDGRHMHIKFESIKGNSDKKLNQEFCLQLQGIFFDLFSRSRLCEWLEQFANGEVVEFDDFNLSRQGIATKKAEGEIIPWTEMKFENRNIMWEKNTGRKVKIKGQHDRRYNIIFTLSKCLKENMELATDFTSE